ncbi:MAG: putative secreted protein [Rhodocyclales bacterium]|nr:putative secreted protein [Rhodocyclales bacterium]
MFLRYCLLVALLLPLQVFAQSAGKITYTEGRLRVIRDASLLLGAQGVAVEAGDMVETSKPGFALIEFTDGTVLALGDATRVMLARYPQGKTAVGAQLLLLEGWLKVQASGATSTAAYAVSSPVQSLTFKDGSLIVHGSAKSGEVFVESGTPAVGITDKQGRPANLAPAKSGQFIARALDKPAASQARPNDAFLGIMPKAFRDALPARLERFKDHNVEAKAMGEVSYADVTDWFEAYPSWRTGFVKRFESRLSDADFRKELDTHLKTHAEWESTLHPPKLR